jgi:hypothetical protein
MDAGIEGVVPFLVLLVDVALAHDAAEADLNMLTRAAEPIVQFEVTESGIEVVFPHQADRTLAKPDAFAPASRAGQNVARFGRVVGTTRGILGGLALAMLGRLLVRILGTERGRHEHCRTEEDCKGKPNYTEHGRTIDFLSR